MTELEPIDPMVSKIERFLKSFKDDNGEYKYRHHIASMSAKESRSFIIDYDDLLRYDDDIAARLYHEPITVLNSFKDAIRAILHTDNPKYLETINDDIQVRIANYPHEVKMRNIDAEHVGKLIATAGTMVRASEVKLIMTHVFYKCSKGLDAYIAADDYAKLKGNNKNAVCPLCGEEEMQIDPLRSKYANIRFVRLQELSEDLPPGQLPYYIDVVLTHDIVNKARPGDRVVLTGIVKIEKDLEEKHIGAPLYKMTIVANNIEFLADRKGDLTKQRENLSLTKEDEEEIKRLASNPDIYETLINSFAPHIYGHEIIKESILLQAVGAPTKILEDGTRLRGDINILLVGDPGVAKSELLKYAARVAPRGLYTSGRGSSAAGLTAAVVRDKSGLLVLEAGATVIGDQGLVCIDEVDKMKPEDRSALHEVMEQQTCSVAKGGIIATLNARASILAAANPILGKYDPYRTFIENVNLPIPLITRFDLVFVVKDSPHSEHDSQLARHILQTHRTSGYDRLPRVSTDMLRKWILYAKRFTPVLSKEAEDVLFEYYMKMRAVTKPEMITITPRQLEALVRLATARARLLLKSKVDRSDAERAVFLFNEMLVMAGIIDPDTGLADIGALHGRSLRERGKLEIFLYICKELLKRNSKENKNYIEEDEIITELIKTGKFDEIEAKRWIERAHRDGTLYEIGKGQYRLVSY